MKSLDQLGLRGLGLAVGKFDVRRVVLAAVELLHWLNTKRIIVQTPTYLEKVNQQQDVAVAAERALAGVVDVSALCPVLQHEGQRSHTGVCFAVGVQQLGVAQRQRVMEGDVTVQACSRHRPTGQSAGE